jgi:hypothetical protein
MESTSMAISDRFTMKALAAGVALGGIAVASSSIAAAVPLTTEYECAPGAPAGKECVAPAAAFAPMAGVPMALPGPVPAPAAPVVPVIPAAPVPVIPAAPVPVVPAAAPVAPMAGGAPVNMAGGLAGKGDPIVAAVPGAPVPGQPLPAGPAGAG